jgi:hypothetical protein
LVRYCKLKMNGTKNSPPNVKELGQVLLVCKAYQPKKKASYFYF